MGPERLDWETPQPQQRGGRAPSTAPTPSQATPTTAPPRPYPPKAAFPKGRPRPVCPPAPTHTPPGITLLQQQRQRDAWRVIQEGMDGARAGQDTSQGSAELGAVGDRWSIQGRSQGTGQGAHGKGRGQAHRKGTKASGSGGGEAHGADQSASSGRQDAGYSTGKGQGPAKDVGTSSSAW